MVLLTGVYQFRWFCMGFSVFSNFFLDSFVVLNDFPYGLWFLIVPNVPLLNQYHYYHAYMSHICQN